MSKTAGFQRGLVGEQVCRSIRHKPVENIKYAFLRQRRYGRQSNSYGFTLLELLFVIVIIGILISMAWPLMQKTCRGFQLNTCARKAYYTFRYLQGAAIGESRVCCLNVSVDEGSFKAFYWSESGFQEMNDARLRQGLRLPQGFEMTMSPEGKTSIYFYPDGRIDQANLTFISPGQGQVSLISEGLVCEIKAT